MPLGPRGSSTVVVGSCNYFFVKICAYDTYIPSLSPLVGNTLITACDFIFVSVDGLGVDLWYVVQQTGRGVLLFQYYCVVVEVNLMKFILP